MPRNIPKEVDYHEKIAYFLKNMDDAIKDCDMSQFSLYMANIFSNSERAFNKGNITQSEMQSFKESATVKITGFLNNCECHKK